ncbi:NAD(P)-dependent oxidoreductase [Labrenzia sp. OB1]|uniref:NAD-dependent epimerase/dehydratase family protein n=1 Tax=Labrenzia sp. OB1 TaxID=1561204 RepID=UPI0007B195AB|nr:NAD(P)-dependent oxidoreductase [Labrenzia sp. OB1]KZM48606.1 NAD-dependent dehydratase [Labrenzia sp. OB1]
MKVLITGAGGTVGRFITRKMLVDGHHVTVLGRRLPEDLPTAFSRYDLADTDPELPQADALIHCALSHEPGKFRGGEGNDPERFRCLNIEGTEILFKAALQAGCGQAVFLSSRAVYGDHRAGELLRETDLAAPDTLYGEAKLAGEAALEGLAGPEFRGVALRATGVYGRVADRADHKWSSLFKAFAGGETVEPRRATEVHGQDLAEAVSIVLAEGTRRTCRLAQFDVLNVSDLVVDRRDLLGELKTLCGCAGMLPRFADRMPGIMETEKLQALGWRPGGERGLRAFLKTCCADLQVPE